jgi:hypothetical protein
VLAGSILEWLRKLEKHATCAFGVYEGDACSTCPEFRLLVNKLGSGAFQAIEFVDYIVHAYANVMETGSAASQKFADWSVGRKRFEQF